MEHHTHCLLWRYARALKRIGPLACADAAILFGAYALVHSVRTGTLLFTTPETTLFVGAAILIAAVALYRFGAYQRIWSRTSGHDVSIILLASFSTTAIVLILDVLITPRPLPLSVVVVSNLLALSGYVGVRYQSRVLTGLQWRWRAIWHHEFPGQQVRVLIVGAGEAGQITALRLKRRSLEGANDYKVVGYVDDDLSKQQLFIHGVPVLAPCAQIPEIVQRHNVDLIVFAIHNITGARFREVLSYCEQTSARIKIIPDVFELLRNNSHAPLLRDIQPEDLLGRQPISWYQGIDAGPVTGKRILVTGAAGSIGSELCRQLLRYDPVQLILLDNNESDLHDLYITLQRDHPGRAILPVLADITQRDRIAAIVARHQPEVIFHAAAYKHVPLLERHPLEAIRVNVGGTLILAEIAQAQGVERFVLISTDKAVNPTGVMGASKRICELIVQAVPVVQPGRTIFAAVRFGNVVGSRGSVVPLFTRQIEAGGPVTVTDERMVRYFMSIPEAVNLVIHAACLTEGHDLFVLRMGEQVPIIELAERMIRLRGLVPRKDIAIEITGIRPGEKLFEELYTATEHVLSTPHPDIVRVNGTPCETRLGQFLGEVRQLEALCRDEDHAAILARLLALARICEPEEQRVAVA